MALSDLLDGLGGRNVLLRAREGLILCNRHDFVIGASMMAYGEYYQSEVNLFEAVLTSSAYCAVDVGANIGTHTLAMSRVLTHGKVIAFEPQREIFRLLSANLTLNNRNNVVTFNACAGAEIDVVKMPEIIYDGVKGHPFSFGGISPDFAKDVQYTYEVPMFPLDQVLHEHEFIRLIKIDVEGHELDVLKGAVHTIAKHKPILYVENDRLKNSVALLTFIKSLGYRMFWHLPLFHNPDNFARCVEPIHHCGFVKNKSGTYESIGFGINMLCINQDEDCRDIVFDEVEDLEWHPYLHGLPSPKMKDDVS